MKTDQKTLQQQKAYFLFQSWIADEMNAQNIQLANLVTEIKPKPTKESLHIIFKSISYKMYSKDSTTTLTREEMNNILEVYMIALASTWIHIEFPDREKQNLLNYYQ